MWIFPRRNLRMMPQCADEQLNPTQVLKLDWGPRPVGVPCLAGLGAGGCPFHYCLQKHGRQAGAVQEDDQSRGCAVKISVCVLVDCGRVRTRWRRWEDGTWKGTIKGKDLTSGSVELAGDYKSLMFQFRLELKV